MILELILDGDVIEYSKCSLSNDQVEVELSPWTVDVIESVPLTWRYTDAFECCGTCCNGLNDKDSCSWGSHERRSWGDVLVTDCFVELSWHNCGSNCWCIEVPYVSSWWIFCKFNLQFITDVQINWHVCYSLLHVCLFHIVCVNDCTASWWG